MDKSSARGAKLSWQAVLKEYNAISDRDVSIWYFHEAAMESQLFFHSTHPVNSTDPSAHTRCSRVCTQHYIVHNSCMLIILNLH